MSRKVFLTAGEVHTAAGPTLAATAAACLQSAPTPITVELPYLQGSLALPYFSAGLEADTDAALARVARSALAQAGIKGRALRDTALLLGTSSGDVGRHEQEYRAELLLQAQGGPPAIAVRLPGHGLPVQRLAAALGIEGPTYTLTTACSAAANALLLAARLVQAGRVRHALVLGVETHNTVSLLGFHGLMLIAKGGYRPFDARRDGIVLGEALGAAVVSASPNGPLRWQLLGGKSLCDTAHPTSSTPSGIARVVAGALADARQPAQAIVAIKAHGTGTPSNDEAEAQGLAQVFGPKLPPFTSLKPALGHTLGACGVVETLSLLQAVDTAGLPPTHPA